MTPQAAARPAPLKGEPLTGSRVKPPLQGLRSRAPPAADTARRSRDSGRRMQAPLQGAQHDAPTATRGWLPQADGRVETFRATITLPFARPLSLRLRRIQLPYKGSLCTAGSRPRPTVRPGTSVTPPTYFPRHNPRAACARPPRPAVSGRPLFYSRHPCKTTNFGPQLWAVCPLPACENCAYTGNIYTLE